MSVSIRKLSDEDIPYKVKWINDEENNKYLHYELPLEEEKTLRWFKNIKNKQDRLDLTILYKGEPAGLIGLLNISNENKDAEYYVCMGGSQFKGKGIASQGTKLLIALAYEQLKLESIYLYTEVENKLAQKLFEKNGFIKEKKIIKDIFYNNKHIDRYFYRLNIEEYLINYEANNIEL